MGPRESPAHGRRGRQERPQRLERLERGTPPISASGDGEDRPAPSALATLLRGLRHYEHLLWLAAALAFILTVGFLGYWFLEGWTPLEALYMTVITLSTVGYGEPHPLSSAGKLFTIALIIVGVSVVAYGVSSMTAFFVEGELKDVLRRSRMQAKIDRMEGHYIICGSGHSGQVILRELIATQRPLVAIELEEEKYRKLIDDGVPAVLGDATQDEVLRRAGIERAQGLFAALGTDRDNAFVCLTARGLNPKLRIIAEQVEQGVRQKLERSGADAVVRPSRIGGMRMASEMLRPAVVGFLDSMLRDAGDAVRIEDLVVPPRSPFAGKPLSRLKTNEGGSALILAVKHGPDNRYEINPSTDRPLAAGETLVVMATVEQRSELARKLAA